MKIVILALLFAGLPAARALGADAEMEAMRGQIEQLGRLIDGQKNRRNDPTRALVVSEPSMLENLRSALLRGDLASFQKTMGVETIRIPLPAGTQDESMELSALEGSDDVAVFWLRAGNNYSYSLMAGREAMRLIDRRFLADPALDRFDQIAPGMRRVLERAKLAGHDRVDLEALLWFHRLRVDYTAPGTISPLQPWEEAMPPETRRAYEKIWAALELIAKTGGKSLLQQGLHTDCDRAWKPIPGGVVADAEIDRVLGGRVCDGASVATRTVDGVPVELELSAAVEYVQREGYVYDQEGETWKRGR